MFSWISHNMSCSRIHSFLDSCDAQSFLWDTTHQEESTCEHKGRLQSIQTQQSHRSVCSRCVLLTLLYLAVSTDMINVAALWLYSGKRYMLMFPPPQHQTQQHSPHMAPPGPPPMPPPSYEEDSAAQAAARGYVYAYPPYGYPGQVDISCHDVG